ncbi:DUF4256 domain-containing protein [Peptostreptococcus equinus]|uniref:DUF4256 domain-containing protein n=1 Tax=Peptostreptococcus equinus TaxID=3003601 RepID=A0ABY7JRE5_9FIRM|nr:DUF4256 domain-containing protein [Peptostreptococcus sp. CBA3647]WAW14550.1 DUF4256 domain-containing protein [Peptostreptococcus sp. CBA3647]
MKNIEEIKLDNKSIKEFIKLLELRFLENMHRHPQIDWVNVENRLEKNRNLVEIIYRMEKTGGEPDLIEYDEHNDKYIFCDFSIESPSGRRSLCYDLQAWEKRKKNKPISDAHTVAEKIGIEILDENWYRKLQSLGDFDFKSSSWIETPNSMRKLGGGLFGDKRYNRTFIYHNGVESYYASRGFRGLLRV